MVATYHTKYDYDIRKRAPTKPFAGFLHPLYRQPYKIADEVWVVSEAPVKTCALWDTQATISWYAKRRRFSTRQSRYRRNYGTISYTG